MISIAEFGTRLADAEVGSCEEDDRALTPVALSFLCTSFGAVVRNKERWPWGDAERC